MAFKELSSYNMNFIYLFTKKFLVYAIKNDALVEFFYFVWSQMEHPQLGNCE